MKKIFNALKDWSTRKTTLWFAIVGMTLYMLVGTVYTLCSGNYLDSTMTNSWFDAMKWVVGVGGGLTAVNVIKGKESSESQEDDNPDVFG